MQSTHSLYLQQFSTDWINKVAEKRLLQINRQKKYVLSQYYYYYYYVDDDDAPSAVSQIEIYFPFLCRFLLVFFHILLLLSWPVNAYVSSKIDCCNKIPKISATLHKTCFSFMNQTERIRMVKRIESQKKKKKNRIFLCCCGQKGWWSWSHYSWMIFLY